MATYNKAPMFQSQFVANAAAALVFAPVGGAEVPPNVTYELGMPHVVNITSSPVTLKMWRVEDGETNDNEHISVPVTVVVPVASNTFPEFQVTALFGAVLRPGDAIWGLAGTASALVVSCDGLVITGNS